MNRESVLINDNEVRILEEVKPIPYIPTTNYVGLKYAAKYFMVGENVIKATLLDNPSEFEEDDVLLVSKADVFELVSNSNDDNVEIITSTGKYHILYNNETMEMPYSKSKLLTKRAMLKLAGLLKCSAVAGEIRNRLPSDPCKIIELSDINKSNDYNSNTDYDATLVADNAINALQNLYKLIKDIEDCKEKIIAYDKFSQDILHDIEMNNLTDGQLLTKAKMIKDVRNKRRYNKNVEIISEFINKQMTNAGLNANKIEVMISKMQNAKAKLEATENGKAYNKRFDELNENQKQVIEQEVLSLFA